MVSEEKLETLNKHRSRKNNQRHGLALRYGHEILRLRSAGLSYARLSDWYCRKHGRRYSAKFWRQVTEAARHLAGTP